MNQDSLYWNARNNQVLIIRALEERIQKTLSPSRLMNLLSLLWNAKDALRED